MNFIAHGKYCYELGNIWHHEDYAFIQGLPENVVILMQELLEMFGEVTISEHKYQS